MNLRLALTIGVSSPERSTDVLARQVEPARVAIETLTSLSRGIYPSVLSDDGLGPALRSAVGSSAIPVVIEAEDLGRLPASVEAALYFCCMEAVQNAAKHSGAETVTVRLGGDGRRWRLVVADDGTGFDQARVRAEGGGAGLLNMRDRLDAVGGTVSLGSRFGEGTTVTAVVPVTRGG